MPGQKQTRAGHHVGLGAVKCAKEVATAIRGAIILAKLSVIPVRKGYWGNKIGKPHTVPCNVTGRCGGVQKLLHMSGIEDCYTSAHGSTATLGNIAKATYLAIKQT
ncbi:40S ribosomal protein S2, putative [Ixodes scapularis]|uniref:Small ribosomal subunit protein uS5 n=1 Tax=Ixodes scapularis TaxID=6945 RepID=B7PE99_IXOSC|nr:40S ribosomal protein S2, putative [Ixodes scapularis]|eukprot:XP_002400503.1 40S ribosomal protein S2, putative [Ixodes scapularis]